MFVQLLEKKMRSESEFVELLDARGLRCPLPLLKMRQALRQLPAGGLLRVQSDDRASADDIPRWLATSEHQLVEQRTSGGEFSFLVRN